MKNPPTKSTGKTPSSEVQLAHLRLANAESTVKSAKEHARLPKQKREATKKAARLASGGTGRATLRKTETR